MYQTKTRRVATNKIKSNPFEENQQIAKAPQRKLTIKRNMSGGASIKESTHEQFMQLLDRQFFRWSHEITNLTFRNQMVIISVRITTESGVREAIVAKRFSAPKDIRSAEQEALAKAASMFLSRDSRVTSEIRKSVPFPSPMAASIGDLITGSQLSIIKRLAMENELDAESETQRYFSCEIGELSRGAAEWYIDYLQEIAENKSQSLRMIA